MLPDRLQDLRRILGRPLEPVGSVDVGHTEPRRVALVPFEVARRVETTTSAVAHFGLHRPQEKRVERLTREDSTRGTLPS